ncbi:MAG: trimethylamine methyltransferase family protein [bacterium]|nr:trimethylamine methyltransferase family protein [bacterium]
MTPSDRPNRRGRARETKRRERANRPEPAEMPVRPGFCGGAYRPLTDDEVTRVCDAAFDVLAHLGVADPVPRLIDAALDAGAELNDAGRLCLPRPVMEALIDGAAKNFTLYGRSPRHDLDITGDRVHFGTGGAAISVFDHRSDTYRPSTLIDLYDFTRLADQLANVHWFTRCVIATDFPDPYDLDINTAYCLLAATAKHTGTAITVPENVKPVVEMFDIAAGGPGEFARRPFCKLHTSPIVPPLRYGADACETLISAVEHGMPINAITAGQAGATSPAPLAGTLVITVAETLASLALVNLTRPGHPMIFSNWPFVSDLRTGSMVGGSAETAVLNAAAAQVAKRFGIPCGVAAGMADSKLPDAQAGYEKGITTVLAGTAGANLVYESSGMLASLLGASFEQFVIDDELLGYALRAVRGLEVTDETLALDVIESVVYGEGHFLGTAQTLSMMETEYLYPSIGDRSTPGEWEQKGAPDIRAMAQRQLHELMQNHPMYLTAEQDSEIRDRFPIALHPGDMSPDSPRWTELA